MPFPFTYLLCFSSCKKHLGISSPKCYEDWQIECCRRIIELKCFAFWYSRSPKAVLASFRSDVTLFSLAHGRDCISGDAGLPVPLKSCLCAASALTSPCCYRSVLDSFRWPHKRVSELCWKMGGGEIGKCVRLSGCAALLTCPVRTLGCIIKWPNSQMNKLTC